MKTSSKILCLGAAGATGAGLYVLGRRSGRDTVAETVAEHAVEHAPTQPSDVRVVVAPKPRLEPFGAKPPKPWRGRRRKAITRRFDPIFAKHAKGLPLAYLRALAKRESNMNPKETEGPAWGLMQVVEVVRRDHNKDHGTAYTRVDLLRPAVNIEIAATLLRRIIRSFQRNHPDVPNLQPDWANPRFVELLTFAWNAGWSERGGIGRVVRYLKKRGKAGEITVELIHAHARDAGAARFLSEAGRMRWSKSVGRYYMSERLRELDRPVS